MRDVNSLTITGVIMEDAFIKRSGEERWAHFEIGVSNDSGAVKMHYWEVHTLIKGEREAYLAMLKEGRQVCISGEIRQWVPKDGGNAMVFIQARHVRVF